MTKDAEARQAHYLKSLADIERLAYRMVHAHIEMRMEFCETVEELSPVAIKDSMHDTGVTLYAPNDALGTIESLLAAQGETAWEDGTLEERVSLTREYVEHFLIPKMKALVPIVMHHYDVEITNLKVELTRERRAREAAANATDTADTAGTTPNPCVGGPIFDHSERDTRQT